MNNEKLINKYPPRLCVSASTLFILFSLLIVTCSLLIVSCSDPLIIEDIDTSSTPASPGYGYFSMQLENDVSRRILPDVDDVKDELKLLILTFTGTDSTGSLDPILVPYADRDEPIQIPVGTYSLKVVAYTDENGNNPALEGSSSDNFTINTTGNADVPIILGPYIPEGTEAAGTGNFEWDITWNVTNLSEITARIVISNFSTNEIIDIINLKENGLIENIAVGSYRAVIILERTGYAPVTDQKTLVIYRNLTSLYKETFTDASFSNPNSSTNPFEIWNEEQLRAVGRGTANTNPLYHSWTMDAHYKLMADVVLTGGNWGVIGDAVPNVFAFSGTFDGNNNKISNIVLNTQNSLNYWSGMFALIHANGIVENLTVVVNIIHNAYQTDTPGEYIGDYIGGIAGQNNGTIRNCFVLGTIGGEEGGSVYEIGGIVGMNNGSIENCISSANVRTLNPSDTASGVGGIAGYNQGTIQNSYNTGTVSGINNIGGIVGLNYSSGTFLGLIKNCYNSGNVSGSSTSSGIRIGGIVGFHLAGTVSNNVSISLSVTGNSNVGRIIGSGSGSLSNNYARSDMTLPSGITVTSNSNGLHGEDRSAWEPTWFASIGFTDSWWSGKLPTGGIFTPGSGTAGDPYRLNKETIITILESATGWNTNAHYVLVEDIVLTSSDSEWKPIGDSYNMFEGSFDGKGYTITGLRINSSAMEQGMIGVIGFDAEVKNIGLINVDIIGSSYVGGIAGVNYGTISNCFVTGNISGNGSGSSDRNLIGGITGNNAGKIEYCYTTAILSGNQNVGGIAGTTYNDPSIYIKNCVALNPEIIRYSGDNNFFGRIIGSDGAGTFNNLTVNYALSDMLYKNSPSAGGVTSFPGHSANANRKDGANVAASTYNTQAFWQTTMGWNFSTIWEWDSGTNLPKLR